MLFFLFFFLLIYFVCIIKNQKNICACPHKHTYVLLPTSSIVRSCTTYHMGFKCYCYWWLVIVNFYSKLFFYTYWIRKKYLCFLHIFSSSLGNTQLLWFSHVQHIIILGTPFICFTHSRSFKKWHITNKFCFEKNKPMSSLKKSLYPVYSPTRGKSPLPPSPMKPIKKYKNSQRTYKHRITWEIYISWRCITKYGCIQATSVCRQRLHYRITAGWYPNTRSNCQGKISYLFSLFSY